MLMDKVRVLLKEGQLEGRYWGEALLHAAFLHNCLTSTALKFKTLLETLLGELMKNLSIRTFACAAYLHQH